MSDNFIVTDKVDWENVQGVPATFAPSAHTHPVSEVSDFKTGFLNLRVRNWFPIQTGYANGTCSADSSATPNTVAYYMYGGTASTSGSPLDTPNGGARARLDFSKTHEIIFDLYMEYNAANSVGWFICGALNSYVPSGDITPTFKSFGYKVTNSTIALFVHDGSTLAVGNSIATESGIRPVYIKYVNGTLTGTYGGITIPTVTGGPTGLSTAFYNCIIWSAKAGPSGERNRSFIYYPQSLTY